MVHFFHNLPYITYIYRHICDNNSRSPAPSDEHSRTQAHFPKRNATTNLEWKQKIVNQFYIRLENSIQCHIIICSFQAIGYFPFYYTAKHIQTDGMQMHTLAVVSSVQFHLFQIACLVELKKKIIYTKQVNKV